MTTSTDVVIVICDNKPQSTVVKLANKMSPKKITKSSSRAPSVRRKSRSESKAGASKAKTRRKRRSPEEARRLILEAAERVFSEHGPDAAGLKVVAAEAGVTHGLVTHYFRTYEALVEATMERAVERARQRIIERLAGMSQPSPSLLLHSFFEIVEEEKFGRLFAWLMLRGSLEEAEFFARRIQGTRKVADILEARIRDADPPPRHFDRDELDFILVLVIAVGLGMGAGAGVLWEGLGRQADAEQVTRFRSWLAELIEDRLEHAFGLTSST